MTDLNAEACWLVDAAKGDVHAQTALVHWCIAHGAHGIPPFEALAMAEPFARLAAAQGGAFEVLLLADVLVMRSVELRKAGHEARAVTHRESAFALYDQVAELSDDMEAISLLVACLTKLADADEGAADRLNKVMDRLPAKDAAAVRQSAKSRLRSASEFWDEIAAITTE